MSAREPARILGIDLSLNHAGLVLLDQHGERILCEYVADARAATHKPLTEPAQVLSTLLPTFSKVDAEQHQLERVNWWHLYLSALFARVRPTHIGIEGYAVKSNNSKQRGTTDGVELGGVARLAAFNASTRPLLRFPGPGAVKMCSFLNGNAEAPEIIRGVRDAWGVRFDDMVPAGRAEAGAGRQAVEDMCAGYAIARFLWLEVELRAGRILPEQLHAKQRQAFLSVAKKDQRTVLMREWLARPA